MRDQPTRGARDGGFTLVELLIVISILGVIVSTLSTAIVVIIRNTPSATTRIDDARTLRGISTWMAYDVTSTPPFDLSVTANSNGGMDPRSTATNVCNAPGQNVLQLSWIEFTGTTQSYVASYRYVDSSGERRLMRTTCWRTGSGAYGNARTINLTAGLSATVPVASFDTNGAGRITVVKIRLFGASGEQVVVDTSSRNPAEFLP